MPKKTNVQVSKLDAAKRQLETAIRLYFNDADPVSIHTLAVASHDMLVNLQRNNSFHNETSRQTNGLIVRDKYMQEIKKTIKSSKQSLQQIHNAGKSFLSFSPREIEFLLFDAVEKYVQLTSEHVPYLIIFRGWFVYKHQPMFRLPHGRNIIINNLMKHYKDNKAEYFSAMLSASGGLA